MVIYSINDIEKLTGVKAHTLRIWEKRYNVIPNRRTESNIRFYLHEDLQLILNIAMLNNNGLKISKIACLKKDEMKQMVADYCNVDIAFEAQLDAITLSILELNEYKFLKILNHEISIKGFEQTMEDTVFPLLDKLSMMWLAGSVKGMHENFVNNIIRGKLIVEIDKLGYNTSTCSKKFILFLPESENHEMSLLYASFVLKKYGANILYLGADVTTPDLVNAVSVFKPNFIFTIMNDEPENFRLQSYLDELGNNIKDIKILMMGYQMIKHNLNFQENISVINSVDELRHLVQACNDSSAK